MSIKNLNSVEEIHSFLYPENYIGKGIQVKVDWTGRKYIYKDEEFRLNDLVRQVQEIAQTAKHDANTNSNIRQIVEKIRVLDRRGDKVLEEKNILLKVATFFRRLFGNLVFNRKQILNKLVSQFNTVIVEKIQEKAEGNKLDIASDMKVEEREGQPSKKPKTAEKINPEVVKEVKKIEPVEKIEKLSPEKVAEVADKIAEKEKAFDHHPLTSPKKDLAKKRDSVRLPTRRKSSVISPKTIQEIFQDPSKMENAIEQIAEEPKKPVEDEEKNKSVVQEKLQNNEDAKKLNGINDPVVDKPAQVVSSEKLPATDVLIIKPLIHKSEKAEQKPLSEASTALIKPEQKNSEENKKTSNLVLEKQPILVQIKQNVDKVPAPILPVENSAKPQELLVKPETLPAVLSPVQTNTSVNPTVLKEPAKVEIEVKKPEPQILSPKKNELEGGKEKPIKKSLSQQNLTPEKTLQKTTSSKNLTPNKTQKTLSNETPKETVKEPITPRQIEKRDHTPIPQRRGSLPPAKDAAPKLPTQESPQAGQQPTKKKTGAAKPPAKGSSIRAKMGNDKLEAISKSLTKTQGKEVSKKIETPTAARENVMSPPLPSGKPPEKKISDKKKKGTLTSLTKNRSMREKKIKSNKSAKEVFNEMKRKENNNFIGDGFNDKPKETQS